MGGKDTEAGVWDQRGRKWGWRGSLGHLGAEEETKRLEGLREGE